MTETGKSEIPALTGVRALAAWWVVLLHLQPAFAALTSSLAPLSGFLANGGVQGVDLFFVLSGFVLSLNYYDRFQRLNATSYGRFLWLRLARIYPVHLVGLAVWAVFLVINTFVGHVDAARNNSYFGIQYLVANLLLVQSWWIPMKMSWNYPAWSISLEWLVYLWFPLFIRRVAGVRGKGLMVGWPLGLLCATGLLVVRFPAAGGLLRISGEFTSGCFLWLLWRSCRNSGTWRFGWITLPSVVIAIILANMVGPYSIPIFGLIVLALALDTGVGARLFGSRAMVYWGKVSYSLYIMHAAMISMCHVALPLSKYQGSGVVTRCGVLLIYVLCIAGASMVTYHFVEEPSRRWMRNRIMVSRKSVYLPVWDSPEN
jgi:peptidoglycan/LPS O-acetylase OafA/YrhL